MNLRDQVRSDWSSRPAWTVFSSREEFGGDRPLLSLSTATGIRERSDGEGRAASDDTSGYRVVRVGDIVINRLVAREGAIAVSTLNGIISPAYWVFRPHPHADSRYLNYLLHSSPYLAEIARRSKFMPPAQFDLPWEQFRTLPIVCPDLSVQRAIADYLDTEATRIDALITKKQRLIELLEAKRRTAVAEGISGHGSCSGLRLRNVCRLVRGSGFPPEHQGRDEGALPFFKVSDLSRPANDPYLRECGNWISHETAAALGATVVPPGSVMFPKIGAALAGGVRRITTVPSVCDNNVLAIVPTDIDAEYLRYWLSTVDLAEIANPGPVPSLDDDALRDLLVPIADRSSQSKIAKHLDVATGQLNSVAVRVLSQVGLLREHRQALITAVATGELEVSGAAA